MISWIQKAEDHFEAALILHRRRKKPLPAHVCYFCRLAAEYYLKAFLLFNKESVFPSNDLNVLVESCIKFSPALEIHKELFETLDPYTDSLLKAGKSATLETAQHAVNVIRRIRRVFMELLPAGTF